ncbi:CopD family protein [Blastococcus sp. URHD0036]|uniref:CopD family protein n=1 Tax=Blastococcus sp. URHD0036 TaxID=1380356 RepID=UPI00068B2D73|nr:CopD family protein [Blastococcus sp. URHD0036]
MTALLPGPAPAVEAPEGPPAVRSSSSLVVAGAVALGAVLVLALLVGGGAPGGEASGLADAGPLVGWGLPVVTLAARMTALATIGTLLFAAVLLPGAVLPGASRSAVRAASRWALAWAATTVVQALLTVSELVGVPPTALTAESVRTFLTHLPAGDAAVGTLAAATAVAVAAGRCAGSGGARLLLLIAGAGVVLPAVLTGHSAAAEDHLLTTTTLAVHVVAASVWVGGLLAVLVHGRGRDDLSRAAGRFSVVALGCAAAVGVSGLLAAWLVLSDGPGIGAGLGSGYGLLLIGKTVALGALLAFGRQHRRRTLPDLGEGRPGAFRRFAAVEVGVMLATVALAVALAASPPPAAAASTPGPVSAPASAGATAAPPPGHDHGDLVVPVLVDPSGFTVTETVAPGSVVTVHNPTDLDVTVTADDGSFDRVVPAGSLTSFPAPETPGSYPFTSRHDPAFTGVLVVG